MGRERNLEFGIQIHTTIYKIDNNKDLLYRAGSYIHYVSI